MEESKTVFADGIYFDRPREGGPSFVKGRVSIKVDQAIAFLNQHKNEKGYVNLDLKEAKDTKKLYLALNAWKPTEQKTEELSAEDKPF